MLQDMNGSHGSRFVQVYSSLSGTEYGGSIPVRSGLLAVGTEANKGRSSFLAEPLPGVKHLIWQSDHAMRKCHPSSLVSPLSS